MTIDDSAPIHERRKLVKTYIIMLPRKRIVDAEVSRDAYFNDSDKME